MTSIPPDASHVPPMTMLTQFVVVRLEPYSKDPPAYWRGDPAQYHFPVHEFTDIENATRMSKEDADRVALFLLDRSAYVRELLNFIVEPAP